MIFTIVHFPSNKKIRLEYITSNVKVGTFLQYIPYSWFQRKTGYITSNLLYKDGKQIRLKDYVGNTCLQHGDTLYFRSILYPFTFELTLRSLNGSTEIVDVIPHMCVRDLEHFVTSKGMNISFFNGRFRLDHNLQLDECCLNGDGKDVITFIHHL